MAEDKPNPKWAPKQSSLDRQCSGKKEALLRGENIIFELMSTGAPLFGVLDKLCAAIDRQIGGIVSVILPAEGHGNDRYTHARNALQFGLHVFWSGSIPIRSEDVLGSLEMYCCVSRRPTRFELQLIERVTHLAAIAIQRHNHEEDFRCFSKNWAIALRRASQQRASLN